MNPKGRSVLIALLLMAMVMVFSSATARGETEGNASASVDAAVILAGDGDMSLQASKGSPHSRIDTTGMEGVSVAIHPATGVASFVRLDRSQGRALSGESAAERTASFFGQYGQLFRAIDMSQLALQETRQDNAGTHLTYAQEYQGVPVFAGGMRAHFSADGALYAVNGHVYPRAQREHNSQLIGGCGLGHRRGRSGRPDGGQH